MGSIGGTVSILLSTGQQDITIIDRPGTITLTGASGGNDIVRFSGSANSYTITRSGSRAIISDGDTSVAIAVSGSPINLVFADGTRSLRADGNTVLLGSQIAVTTPAAITAAPDVGAVVAAGNPDVRGQLIVAEGEPVVVSGPFDVFGTTSGAEVFTALGGNIAVRSGFAGGLDTIVFEGSASAFTATRSASQVILEGPGLRISIPVSSAGVMLQFADDTRSLRFDAEAGQVVVGDQIIGNAPITLSAANAVSLIDLGDLAPSQGFAIEGSEPGDRAGRSVSSAGDLNGDGFDDIVIGVTGANGQAGETYVLFGSATPFPARTAGEDLNGANGFRILGQSPFGESGFSVSSAGDVNGDGLADLLIGAPNASSSGAEASYVIFGSTQRFGLTLALTDLNGTNGFRINGALPGSESGFSVANAGDVDGDGIDDLIIGAHRATAAGRDLAGSSYIVFGSVQGFGASLDLATPGANRITRIDGGQANGLSGFSVAGAGDVNGDGIDDVIIGAPGAEATYVVFGAAGGLPPVVNLAGLNGTNGFRLAGAAGTSDEGFSVAGIGDINGDGIDDLAIGAPATAASGAAAGATFAVFGSATPFAASLDLAALALTAGFVISGSGAGDQAGFAVAGAGDVNGDGLDDLIIGARLNDGGGINAGEAYVIFGRPRGSATNLNVFDLDGSNGFRIRGAGAGDEAGFSVASAGDVNGDGFDDLIIGAAGTGGADGQRSGAAYVIYGGATGTENTAAVTRTGTAGGDNLIGNGGNDVLIGGGGADVIRGGAGNDRISIADLAFADIAGGRGTDTLALAGSGLTLDLTGSTGRRLDSIEAIDLTGSGNNRLIVSERAIANLTEARSGGDARLIVTGNAGDTVEARGFVANLAQPIGALGRTAAAVANPTQTIDGITYNVFVSGNSILLAQQGVTVITNRAPVIESAAAFSIGENQRDAFKTQATDADGDALTYSLSGADAALFSINPANGFVAFLTAPDFEQPRDANFDNRYQITVTVSDGRESASQAVTVTVTDVNEAPTAVADAFSMDENTVLSRNVLTNDVDPDGDALSATITRGAANGTIVLNPLTGAFDYTPNPNFFGTDSFEYRASDGSLSSTATVTITVINVNEPPVGTADTYTTAEDNALNVIAANGVLSNDNDIDSDPLTAVLVTGPTNGTLTLNPNGSFSYTPATNFNGVDSFTYLPNDGTESGAAVTVTINVTPVNDAPVGVPDSFSTNEDQALTILLASLVANDTDAENNLISVAVAGGAVNGVLDFIGGNLVFTPNANFFGTASFTYQPRDSLSALGLSTTVTVTVNPVNDAPTVANPIANQAFDEDTAVNFTVPANTFADVDNANLTYSAQLSGGGSLPSWLNFNATTRTFSGTPTPLNFNGVLDIEVTASDGALSVSDVFRLTITPVNDAPDAPNGTASTDEDTAVTVVAASGLLAGVTDVDGPSLAVTQINGVPFTFGTPITLASGALLTVQSTGAYVYNPNGQFEALRPGQNGNDSFTFTVSDGSLTDTATISVTIAGRNERPIAANDTLTMTGNTPITITGASLLANDRDPDGSPETAITLTAVGGATNGTVVLNGDGSITFTPTTGYTGPASFTYTIQDADGATATGTVNVTVSGLVWYVDNSYAGGNGASDGSFLRPFTSLDPLNGVTGDGTTNDDVDGVNQTIFVYNRGTSYTSGITLEAGQRLFGDGHEFTVNGTAIGAPATTTNSTIQYATYGVVLATDNDIRGITFSGSASGAIGIEDGNGTVGNLTIANVSVIGSGKAVDIDQGGNLAVSLTTLSSSGSSSEGVHLQGVTGSFTAASGSISSSTNQGFLIGAAGGGTASSGGNATITYGGSITNAGGAAVEIQDRTGGTVSFNGTITETAGAGIVADGNAGTINFGGQIAISSGASTAISLTNNSAAINFTPTGDGLDITTTTGNGFIVDGGGGTVTLSGTGNAITTTSGRAVEIDGVTIGTGGVNFQSVSITNGTATTGIFLRNAGSGGFTITGTASTGGSGGTINSIDSGTDGSIEQGIGIFIQNTNNISLSNIDFTGNFANFGIRGSAVNNFTLRDSTFNAADTDDGGFGDNSGQDEGVIRFTGLTSTENGLTGTALFEGNTISDGHEDVLRIDNSSGALNLIVRDSTSDQAVIGRNGTTSGNDGIIVNGSGNSNITVLIDGVEFTGSRGDIIQTVASGTATQNITIRNNTFANLHPDVVSGGGGVSIGLSGGTGPQLGVTYNVQNNTFTGAEGTVIFVGAIGPVGSMSGTILNNTIGTANGIHDNAQASAGSNNGGGAIAVQVEKTTGGGSLTSAVRIEGNTIRDVDGEGIFLRSNGAADGSGTARLEATIRNNTIAELGNAAFAGIYAQIGGLGSNDNGLLGLDISNNTINVNGATTAAAAIAFDDAANASQFYLPGFVGTPTDANVLNFLTATRGNTLTVTSPAVQFSSLATGTYLTGTNFSLGVPLMIEPGTTGTGNGVQATLSALEALREAAVQLWIDAGASDAQIAAMRAVELNVADLYGGFIGQTTADGITIDIDAAGIGWFIDATPFANEEFAAGPDGLTALSGSEAAGGIDLLTALAHELGHIVGLADVYGSDVESVMDGFLALGERNLPEAITALSISGGGSSSAAGSGAILLAEMVSSPASVAIGLMPQIVPADASVL